MRNRITKLEMIDWRAMQSLQPDNIKHVFNYAHIEASTNKHGFAQPFAVWRDPETGIIYTVDGHTRKEVLQNNPNTPDLLPAYFVEATSREDAIMLLLEVYNQKHNPIDQQVLLEWLELEEMELESVLVESLDLKVDYSQTDYSLKNQELDMDAMSDKMTIKLEYTQDEYNIVKEQLSRIAHTPEQAVWQLLGNE